MLTLGAKEHASAMGGGHLGGVAVLLHQFKGPTQSQRHEGVHRNYLKYLCVMWGEAQNAAIV